MASSADATAAPRRPTAAPSSLRGPKRWLLLGVCFGLGYGITHRLVAIRLETGWSGRQRFEVRTFPGTELESLRRRFADDSMQIRGDLDLLELERQQKRDAAAIELRRSQTEERERRDPSPSDPTQPAADPSVDLPPLPEPPSLPPAPEPAPATVPEQQPVAAPATPGTTP